MNNGYEKKLTVENVIYGGFVKYDRLQQQVFNTFSNTSIAAATHLNVFVDLYSILKSVFSEHNIIDISDYTAVTSGVINLCSHYRGFFKRLGVHTTFYLIASLNICDINRKFVMDYNEKYYSKFQIQKFADMVNSNFDLLELLCPYLPDIHFVKSSRNFETSVIMAHIIETLNDGQPNLIISRDLYPLQLCYQYPYTSYLYPLKKFGVDESIMVPISEKPSFRAEFWNLVSKVRKFDVNTVLEISPVNYVLFSAMNRFPERYITGITNVVSTKNYIRNIVGGEDIIIQPAQLYENNSANLQVSVIESRMKALDVQFMLPYYRNDPESRSIQFKNLRDDSVINMINARFFAHNPIDISKL